LSRGRSSDSGLRFRSIVRDGSDFWRRSKSEYFAARDTFRSAQAAIS
jgi:hypothetical protein